MGGVFLFFFYGSILFCVIASLVRMTKYVRAPLPLRWELYRGSSIYEMTDWWEKRPRRFREKVRTAALDILFLREYYHRNRGFWYFLLLFHIGLYLLILWHLWLFIGAVTLPFESAGIEGLLFGHVATGLSLIGGSGVLTKRIVDEELNVYYPRTHYLKWFLLLIILVGGLLSVVFHFDSNMPELLRYVQVQVTFQDLEQKLHPALAPASHVFLVSFLLLYLPFSHILQVFFRYYHRLRWDEVPNREGSTVERKVQGQLNRRISWSAPHIKSGKRWREVIGETREP